GGDADKGRATSPLPPSPADQAGNSLDDTQRQIEQMQVQQMQLLAQMKRELARLAATDPSRPAPQNTPAARAEEERRRQLLDQLAQIEKRINDENARPRRRYVSPSAREGVHAVYYDALRSRIEDIGTRNFPEDKGVKLYGELSMLLEIDSLGRVVEAEIIQSSGNRLLDRKAQSIVRGAGPYGHFTAPMRAQFDRLVFVSRFRFTREQGLQATVEENQNAPRGR
ncbi:MAG: periplasmic protein TonB, partial [Pseudomonadota bacterium]|nr:periplasmic protein TonB [Pseudomonadota bacterium]